jgi:hypothetical protein
VRGRRLSPDYADLFREVRAILNRHDPVGLIEMGCPETRMSSR